MLAAIIAAGISFGLMWHLFYGFDNLPLTPNQPLSPNAFPITLQIPYDIPFVGIFAIGFYVKLIDKADEWPPLWIKSLLWSILTTAICIILFFSMKLGAMDLKAPLVLFAYIPILFFFIIIPEEAFYRGFLQEAITRKLNNKLAPFLALLVVGLLFAITRIPLAPTLSFFFFSFFQSLFYSGAYYLTGFIEGAIITRSIFTLIHLFLLTYPSFT
ncbi:MAG: hypothetical protein S4CHLAM102_05180 [Chlamydiia bacterium]|nr:hypothetical protein [Chlamydiia bacterium]